MYFLGGSPISGGLPSFHLLQSLLRWFRLVRTFASEEILHETVFAVCLDTRRLADRSDPVLFDHQEHFWRFDLVHSARFHDNLQWHHGLRVWVFLRKNSVDQAIAQENLGRIYWGWGINCYFWVGGMYMFFEVTLNYTKGLFVYRSLIGCVSIHTLSVQLSIARI